MGGWPAPFGITLVADLLSAIMVVLTGIIGLAWRSTRWPPSAAATRSSATTR
jgi:formate hydrogenlyase subunit 3/multisubunit Na+/H+ antiporter MnhD subunit